MQNLKHFLTNYFDYFSHRFISAFTITLKEKYVSNIYKIYFVKNEIIVFKAAITDPVLS